LTSRYQSNPGLEHWIAVKNILKYLRRTKDLFLIYRGGDLQFDGYTDFDFHSDIDDKKSNFGYVFICNGGTVSWKSSKQSMTANSTIEAEYITASDAANEAIWIKKFVTELVVVPSIESAVPLHCNNNGAVIQAKETLVSLEIQIHRKAHPHYQRNSRTRRCSHAENSIS